MDLLYDSGSYASKNKNVLWKLSRRSLSLKAFEELTLFNRAGTSKQLALTLICTKLSDKDVKLLIDKITAKS